MPARNDHQPPSRPTTSWAGIVGSGSPLQQQTSSDYWPAITQPAKPKPDVKQPRNDTLVSTLENQLQEARLELERERASAKIYASGKEEVKAKMRKLETNLDNARKKLLSLQPPQEISDDQVKQAFHDLCLNIEDWVDVECQGLGNLKEIFDAKDWTDLEIRIAERHITEDDIKLSEDLPNISSNIVMNAIFSFVYGCCLREERWAGYADAKEALFLNGVVEVMSMQKSACSAPLALEFQSGLRFTNNSQLRRWRSETFQALQKEKYRVQNREKMLKTFVHDLALMLKHFADKKHHISRERLRSKILDPAYALADMIKASPSGYKFNFMVNSSSPNTYLPAEDATRHRLVDAQTGVEEIVERNEGNLGRLGLCVFPGLQKVQDGGERSCMSKALVVLDKSSGPVGKSTAAMAETAYNDNGEKETMNDPAISKKDASPRAEKKESPGSVRSEVSDESVNQTSTTPEGQPLMHHYVWVDIPRKTQ